MSDEAAVSRTVVPHHEMGSMERDEVIANAERLTIYKAQRLAQLSGIEFDKAELVWICEVRAYQGQPELP